MNNRATITRDNWNAISGLIVALVITTWLLIPPVVAVNAAGVPAIFKFFLQDTFYYLSVAANSQTGFYTFDGVHATTGFHPLWQVYLTWLFQIFPPDQAFQVKLVFWASVLFTTIGIALTGLALWRLTGSKILGILIVPGFFNLLFMFVFRFAGSPWSFMNGMESPLTVFFMGLVFMVIAFWESSDHKAGKALSRRLILGVILSLCFISRLDDVFIVISFALTFLWLDKGPLSDRFKKIALITLPSGFLCGLYLLFNYHSSGSVWPVSGAAKAGFALVENISLFVETIFLQNIGPGFNPISHLSDLYRQIQMLFIPGTALVFIVILIKIPSKKPREAYIFLTALLVGICLKAIYNFLFVEAGRQGVLWYYVSSILIFNFMALVLLSEAYRKLLGLGKVQQIGLIIILAIYLGTHLNLMITIPASGKTLEYKFWNNRVKIASELKRRNPDAKIIEYEDGIINYSLKIPTMHGIGFVVDSKAHEAKKRGRMLELAYKRGFNTIGSLAYIRLAKENRSSDYIERFLRRSPYMRMENLEDFEFSVIYIHKPTGATFIGFKPKSNYPIMGQQYGYDLP